MADEGLPPYDRRTAGERRSAIARATAERDSERRLIEDRRKYPLDESLWPKEQGDPEMMRAVDRRIASKDEARLMRESDPNLGRTRDLANRRGRLFWDKAATAQPLGEEAPGPMDEGWSKELKGFKEDIAPDPEMDARVARFAARRSGQAPTIGSTPANEGAASSGAMDFLTKGVGLGNISPGRLAGYGVAGMGAMMAQGAASAEPGYLNRIAGAAKGGLIGAGAQVALRASPALSAALIPVGAAVGAYHIGKAGLEGYRAYDENYGGAADDRAAEEQASAAKYGTPELAGATRRSRLGAKSLALSLGSEPSYAPDKVITADPRFLPRNQTGWTLGDIPGAAGGPLKPAIANKYQNPLDELRVKDI
jgi:hypothetical protein